MHVEFVVGLLIGEIEGDITMKYYLENKSNKLSLSKGT